MSLKILAITPIEHISGVVDRLELIGDLSIINDPSVEDLLEVISDYDVIFTNPNKSKIYLDKEILDLAINLKVICTASTGTNHINKDHLDKCSIELLSLTEERKVINKISSTAEHALALTMSSLRNVHTSFKTVLQGEWNYEDHIGRQVNCLTVGVIGYGRLGEMYAHYMSSIGARVVVFDPYKEIDSKVVEKVESIDSLLKISDIVSLHVHVSKETTHMINRKVLENAKEDFLLINTSRGEIVNEADLIEFLSQNPKARAAVDVISEEIIDRDKNLLIDFAKKSNQILITPHIGGMTHEAQEIAYNHAAEMLASYFDRKKAYK